MLVNLSADEEILKALAEDDTFLETLLSKVTVCRCLYLCSMRHDDPGRCDHNIMY